MVVSRERLAEEQAALLSVATLVAEGASEDELAAAVTHEIGRLFEAQRANLMRVTGGAIRVIGEWSSDGGATAPGTLFPLGGDTITVRVVESAAPARVSSADDLRTEFARRRWAELGIQASIGAPIVVDGEVWGIVTASRTRARDLFPPGAEERLREFAALVAQAIVNAEARQETAQLLEEQSALRHIATLVAGGKPQAEVLAAVTSAAGPIFHAESVLLVHWEGVLDEVVVDHAWTAPGVDPVEPGARLHPGPESATLAVLERGTASSSDGIVAAPVIISAQLLGALAAAGPEIPAGAEVRLRSFADLAAQSIANEQAQSELRASRARIVRAADETRRRLERNLHDGAQQRLISVALALRLAETDPSQLQKAATELDGALHDLRELARGLHPPLLSERGLAHAFEPVTARSPFPVTITGLREDRRLPGPVEAAVYYVVAESLTNAAKHAEASSATVAVTYEEASVTVEIADDGRGGASLESGSGLRGLVDRVEALGGELTVSSPQGGGTLVRAELPIDEGGLSLPPKLSPAPAAMASEVAWEPVVVLVSAEGTAGEEMLSLLSGEYGAAGARDGAWWRLTIRPIDQFRRGTIIYRVIQVSRLVAGRHPGAKLFLVTEDGNRWELPPPELE